MRLFVCYTRRDGTVTQDLLRKLNVHLLGVCTPFIHALDEHSLKFQQTRVLIALLRSTVVLLLRSPGVNESPWVRLELCIARLIRIPVITLEASELVDWSGGVSRSVNLPAEHL